MAVAAQGKIVLSIISGLLYKKECIDVVVNPFPPASREAGQTVFCAWLSSVLAGLLMRRIILFLLLFFCFAGQSWAWQSQDVRLLWQGYKLPAAQSSSGNATQPEASDTRLLLGFTLAPPEGVYFYGPESREGLPTQVSVQYALISPFASRPAPDTQSFYAVIQEKGITLETRLPAAVPKKETSFASVSLAGVNDANTPIFSGPMTFWVEAPSIAPFYSSAAVRVSVSGLLCSAGSCMPFDTKLDLVLDLPVVNAFALASGQGWWADWQKGAAIQLSLEGQNAAAETGGAGESTGSPDFAAAFGSGTRSLGGEGSGLLNANPELAGGADSLELYSSFFSGFSPSYANPDLEVQDLGGALFFGLLAGLILNLMPCVLPVVSLKFTALMAVSAMENKQERAQAFRVHCLIFAAGILTWFAVLAFLLGTAGWAWGELFQSPQVVVVLALIMFLLGLSLFGVYTLPILDLRVSSDSHPHLQSFGSGLLATLLATPCSGPLLGGVIGWALRQPLPVLMLAVGSVGIGMALPYFVLALSPNMVHLLPRPGRWTLRLEQLLGFFLMGSVVYMVTLLPEHWVPAFLFNLLSIAIAAWLWGQIGHLGASRLRRLISRVLAAGLVLLSVTWGSVSVQQDFQWEPFDPQSFMEDLGTEPMLLEFTADWCPSCKAMEHTTLRQGRMANLRQQYKMRTIRVDLTRDDPVAKELLRSLGSGSIPVIALFPEGKKAKEPLVLRDIVTPAQLDEALSRTF